MATSDFLPFAGGAGANVITQAAYAALAAQQTGFQSGVAQSAQLNKVWRQSSIMAAVLAQFIANNSGQNSVDDGTTATLLANLKTALNAAGITQAQFDNSTNLATDAFVFRAVQSLIQKTASKSVGYTITPADTGTLFYNSAALTYTLPDASTCTGCTYGFMSNLGYAQTINTFSAAQKIVGEGMSATSIALPRQNSVMVIMSDGSNWIVMAGSPFLFPGVVRSDGTVAFTAAVAGVTGAQFDNSTNLATDAFVFRAVQSLIQKFVSKGANYTVTTADAGTMFYNSAAVTFSLPDATTCTGVAYGFMSNTGNTQTINTFSAGQKINGENLSATSVSFSKQGVMMIIMSDGSNWTIMAASPLVLAPNVAPVSTAVSVPGTATANTTYTASVSFTAPRSGYVFATGSMNVSAQLNSATAVSLLINGTTASNDTAPTTQSHMGVLSVTQGTVVTVTTQAVTGSTAPGQPFTLHAAALFVPMP